MFQQDDRRRQPEPGSMKVALTPRSRVIAGASFGPEIPTGRKENLTIPPF
jgi:hypothetical protein